MNWGDWNEWEERQEFAIKNIEYSKRSFFRYFLILFSCRCKKIIPLTKILLRHLAINNGLLYRHSGQSMMREHYTLVRSNLKVARIMPTFQKSYQSFGHPHFNDSECYDSNVCWFLIFRFFGQKDVIGHVTHAIV